LKGSGSSLKGKVWLVGAGPSEEGLFTLKGKRVLEQAEVVVYDRLVGQSILTMIPKDAKLIDAGKSAGNHTMRQENINQVLLQEALKGKRVVRLKGGDPFLFGRGGEELELLVENQVPYEIVPGVTSAVSVPAYQGIPVTHRDYCSSVHIITGHKRESKEYDIDFDALVRTRGTLIFLMGVSALADICKGLIDGGMSQDMPAAVLQKGTTSRQKRVTATLSTLEDEVQKQKIETPAIIVIGKVCALAEEFSWYEKLPLWNKRVVVTRPKDRTSNMADKLRNQGAEVLELPAIQTIAIEPDKKTEAVLRGIDSFTWIVFTSSAGVKIFFNMCKDMQIDIRKFQKAKFAVVGPATKKELEKMTIFADLMPDVYDGEHLGNALKEHLRAEDRVLIPRAKIGSQILPQILEAVEGIEICDLPIYDTQYITTDVINVKKELLEERIDYAVFTSASTVSGFAETVKDVDYSKINAICIGRQTKERADSFGMKTYVSKEATMDSMVELLIEMNQ
jgi:uroporphyrinogen III methyltransferase/synthase